MPAVKEEPGTSNNRENCLLDVSKTGASLNEDAHSFDDVSVNMKLSGGQSMESLVKQRLAGAAKRKPIHSRGRNSRDSRTSIDNEPKPNGQSSEDESAVDNLLNLSKPKAVNPNPNNAAESVYGFGRFVGIRGNVPGNELKPTSSRNDSPANLSWLSKLDVSNKQLPSVGVKSFPKLQTTTYDERINHKNGDMRTTHTTTVKPSHVEFTRCKESLSAERSSTYDRFNTGRQKVLQTDTEEILNLSQHQNNEITNRNDSLQPCDAASPNHITKKRSCDFELINYNTQQRSYDFDLSSSHTDKQVGDFGLDNYNTQKRSFDFSIGNHNTPKRSRNFELSNHRTDAAEYGLVGQATIKRSCDFDDLSDRRLTIDPLPDFIKRPNTSMDVKSNDLAMNIEQLHRASSMDIVKSNDLAMNLEQLHTGSASAMNIVSTIGQSGSDRSGTQSCVTPTTIEDASGNAIEDSILKKPKGVAIKQIIDSLKQNAGPSGFMDDTLHQIVNENLNGVPSHGNFL